MNDNDSFKAWANHKYSSKESTVVAIGVFLAIIALMLSVLFSAMYGIAVCILWIFQAIPGTFTQELSALVVMTVWGLCSLIIATFVYWKCWGKKRHHAFMDAKIKYLKRYVHQHPIKAVWELLGLISKNIKSDNSYLEYSTYLDLVQQCIKRNPRVQAYMIRELAKDPNQHGYITSCANMSKYNFYINSLLAELLPPHMQNLVHVYSPKELCEFIVQNTSPDGTWPAIVKTQDALECADML